MTTTNNQRRKRTHGHIRLFGALLLIIIFSFIAIHIFSALGPTPPPNSKSDHGYFSFIFKGITGAVSGELSIPIDSESQVNLTLENTSVENATLENNTINDVNLDNATSSNTTLENITLPILNDSSISNNSDLLNTTLPNENNSLENISNDNNSNNAVVEEPAPFVSSPQEPTVNVSNNNINLPVVDLVIDFKDKSNKKIGKTKIIDDNGKYKLEISSDNKPVKSKGFLGLSSDNSNKKDKKLNVTVYGLQNINDNIKVKADVYSGKNPSHIGFNTEVFGMDPVEMDNATIILEKTGNVDAIFHCSNFDIDNFDCQNWEATNIPFIDHGDTIEFIVTHFSAYGGGEINATSAQHFDENLTFISDIFTKVEHEDDDWSGPIYQNHTVRVTFQTNLSNGNVIDLIARSNNTYAYFDIFIANTGYKVGRSQNIGNAEKSYITLENMPYSNDTFDFKIVKIPAPAWEEDNNTKLNDSIFSFIEFDYIHDAEINTSWADGMIVYAELNVDTPRYRLWNNTNFTDELNAQPITVSTDLNWIILKASHERDEMILGVIDQDKDINVQIYTDNGTNWHSLTEIGTDANNAVHRYLDIAYEDIDGDAVIFYENSSGGDGQLNYATWNGTDFTTGGFNDYTPQSASITLFVRAIPKKNSNDIMVLTYDNGIDIYASLWNGTDLINSSNATGNQAQSASMISNSSSQGLTYDFAWESSSGDGLALYNNGTSHILSYKTYLAQNKSWSDENLFAATATGIYETELCSDNHGDYIGAIWMEVLNNRVNVSMWNGSEMLSGRPAGDISTESSGELQIDCLWINETTAIFGFIDSGALSVDYFTFNKPNTWSTSILTTTDNSGNFASDDIANMRFVQHPTNENKFMIEAQDIAGDLTAVLWNGAGFDRLDEPVLEATLESPTGAIINSMFDWFRYDPEPSVTAVLPIDEGTMNNNVEISINATITDNTTVSYVYANITSPNGSDFVLTLKDTTSDNVYNGTLSTAQTATAGEYNFTIWANDSSTHLNINNTEEGNFTLIPIPTPPYVTQLIPALSSSFNTSMIIEIAANVTDTDGISVVFANITHPNGTVNQLTLNNGTNFPEKFNATFTIPELKGVYNITIIANDTNNDINTTEKTNFTVNVGCGTVTVSITLDQNVYSTGTCFTTGADNIEIDGAGYELQGDGTNYGIHINQNSNVTIKNFARIDNFTFGIYANNFAPAITNQIRNNTIGENITTTGAGIGLDNVSNYNITNNSITISLSNTDAISIINKSLVDKIENITIEDNLINVTASGDEAIAILFSNNILIYNNSIYLSAASGNGINVDFGSVNISENTLVGSSTASNVIKISSNNLNATVSNNNITVSGSPIGILVDGNYTIVNRNIITAYGTGNCMKITGQHGNYLSNNCNLSASGPSPASTRQGVLISGGKNNTLQSNDFYSNGTYAYPVLIFFGASDNRLISNNITAIKSASPALLISATGGVPADNVFQNNTIYSPMSASIYDLSGLSTTNVLSYYNNFGEINWTRNNLTTSNVQIGIGTNVYLENNLVGLADNIGLANLNVSAEIKINNLAYIIPPNLLKNGQRCDAGDECNISYDASSGILIANVSSFSNYTTTKEVTNPSVTSVIPIIDTLFNTSQIIEISANVSDTDHGIGAVLANLTLPNGSAELLTLTNGTGFPDKFNISYNLPILNGYFNITFIANDTTNNINNSVTTNFSIKSVPNVTQPIISPSLPYTNNSLTINSTYTDLDLEAGTMFIRWYINDTNIYNETNQSLSNGTVVFSTLDEHNFSKDDVVNVSIYANDSVGNSAILISVTVTIQNGAPVVTTPTLAPAIVYTNNTITTNTTITDIDGDFANVTFMWYKNGSNIVNQTNVSIANGTAVLASLISGNFSKHDEINISVSGNDTTNQSTILWSTVTTISNTAPDFNQTLLAQSTDSGFQLTMQVNCTDQDADTLTYYDNTSLFAINSSSGLIIDNPTQFEAGSYNINVTCSDGTLNTSSLFLYTINDVDIPTFTNNTNTSPNFRREQNVTANITIHNAALQYYIFQTNVSGTWVNLSQVALGGVTQSNVSEQFNISLAQGNFVCWQYWTNDTAGNYANTTEYCFTVQNTAPNITVPAIAPVIPYTNNSLSINTTYTDIDGTTGSLTFRWYVNNTNIYNFTNSSVTNGSVVIISLNDKNFTKNDQVNVSVFANDSDLSGATVFSQMVTIQNTPPEVTTPGILPTIIYTNLSLTSNSTILDIDSDALNITFQWYRNGSAIFNDTNGTVVNNSVILTTLNSSNFSKHDEINISVWGNDSTNISIILWSSVTTVSNTAPDFNQSLTSQTASSGSTFVLHANCSDVDNDVITYYDNSSLFAINTTSGFISDSPTEYESGSYQFNISCDDGTLNNSQTILYTITDATAPIFSNNTNTSPNFRREENFTANITLNDSSLGYYIFSSNVSGSWVNLSQVSLSGVNIYNASEQVNISATQSQNVCWQYWFNDTTGNNANTTEFCFNVVNTLPIVTTPTLAPATIYTNITITSNTTVTDIDLDRTNVTFMWYKNGSNIINQTNGSLVNGTAVLSSLVFGNFSKHDEINISVYANDSNGLSTTLWSAVTTVSNTAPDFNQSLTSQTASSGSTFVLHANCSDVDNDVITYYDNSSLFAINTTSGFISDSPTEYESGSYQLNISCDDGTLNNSQTILYTITDATAPIFSNNTNTSPNFRREENFTANITLNDSSLGYYIFSSNVSGSWVNLSQVSLSGVNIYNASEQVNISATQSKNICWQYWFNDTTGNNANTTEFCFNVVNTLPVVTTPTLAPATIYTNITITSNTTVTDIDSDSTNVTFMWYRNGSNIINQTNASLTNGTAVLSSLVFGNFSKHDEINISVYANDSNGLSTTLWSAVTTVSNTAPDFNQSLTSQTASSGSTFILHANCSDVDNDVITYYDNSSLFAINTTSGFISDSPTEYESGSYQLNISCDDGTLNNSQTILYTITDATAPIFSNNTNTSPNFRREENFTANITLNDSSLGYYIFSSNVSGSWVNLSQVSLSGVNIYNASEQVNISATQGKTVCWQYWFNDTTGNNANTTEYCFTVQNTPPIASTPSFLPNLPYANETMNVSFVVTDLDNDTLNVTIRWFVNATNIFNQTNNSLVNGTTLLSILDNSNYTKDDVVNISIVINDSNELTVVNSSAITIQNSAPLLTRLQIAPTTAYTNNSLTANTIVVDTDSDNSNVTFQWYVNGSNIYNQTNVSITNGTVVYSTFNYSNFSKHDEVNVTAFANDTFNISVTLNTSIITILNWAPEFNETLANQNISSASLFTLKVNCSDLDNDQIIYYDNTTLFAINSSSGLINQTAGEAGFGSNLINITCGDGTLNVSTTFIYSINDTTSPVVSLTSPANSGSVTSANVDFQCSVTDGVDLDNLTFNIWGPNNNISINSTNVSGTSNSSTYSMFLNTTGTYSWNCLAFDNSSNSASASSNSTLTYSIAAAEDSSSSSSGSSSAGGGGSLPVEEVQEIECSVHTNCPNEKYCLTNNCINAFGLEFIQFDSIIEINDSIDFIYSVKSLSGLSGEVKIEYWVEKEKETITSTKETIQLNMLEEKIQKAGISVPGLEEGEYTLFIKLIYDDYFTTKSRDFQLKKSVPPTLEIELMLPKEVGLSEPWNYLLVVSSNKDNAIEGTVERKIFHDGQEIWSLTEDISLEKSSLMTDMVDLLAPGDYTIEITANIGGILKTIKKEFSVGETGVLTVTDDGKQAIFGMAISDSDSILGSYTVLWILLAMILGIIVFIIFANRRKKAKSKNLVKTEELENWIKKVLPLGITLPEMEKMVVESGWMKEHLYLVLKKIDEEQKKRGNPGNGLAKKEK